ncbi:unnamed protein product [Rotaria socialis]|uniref:MULE transposase domain-containing protein n=1 Tax=Rotaria socialis TaxID=392032 RepID=A0A818I317_9BILA|nr:unnamed protein product [Rotaria socialis]
MVSTDSIDQNTDCERKAAYMITDSGIKATKTHRPWDCANSFFLFRIRIELYFSYKDFSPFDLYKLLENVQNGLHPITGYRLLFPTRNNDLANTQSITDSLIFYPINTNDPNSRTLVNNGIKSRNSTTLYERSISVTNVSETTTNDLTSNIIKNRHHYQIVIRKKIDELLIYIVKLKQKKLARVCVKFQDRLQRDMTAEIELDEAPNSIAKELLELGLIHKDEFDEIRIKLQIRTAAANVITNNTVINVDTLRTIITKLLRMCKITNMDVNEVVTLETGTGGAAGGVNCDNINQVVDGIYRDRELRRQILEFFATSEFIFQTLFVVFIKLFLLKTSLTKDNQIPNLSYNEDTEDDHTSFRTPPISHYALLNQLQTLDMTTTNNNNNDLALISKEINELSPTSTAQTIDEEEKELLAPNLLSVRKKTLPNDIPRLDCGRFFLIVGKKRPQNGIVFKNYHFGMKRINKNGTQVWICTHKLCNAAINICNGSIVKTSSIKPDGSHEFEHQPKMSLDIYECIKSIKRRIEEEPTAAVSLLYDQQVKKFRRENGTAASIPVFDRVKSSLYEYRSSKQPPVPKALSSIDIPYRLTRTLLDQNFLLCNNQLVSVVGFASSIGIKLLGDNAHWNADGTFRTAPKLFYQSYSIHVWDNFSMKPVIYAALPNKNTNTYDTFLNELIVYAQINGISLTPKSILIDFEMAAHQAFSKNFPTAKIKGCQFHFGQNIWRQIKKKGLIS